MINTPPNTLSSHLPFKNRNRFIRFAVLLGAIVMSPFVGATAEIDSKPLNSTDDVYELENLLKIEIFMEQEDWDAVRFSWRGEEKKEVDGKWLTIESDYEHQPGDIVINGVRVGNVGVRKKGLIGSLSSQRPSLKVKFNKFVKGQEFLGIKDLTLNNNKSDAAQVRQYLSYKWFRKAGIAAPRCNFAQVYVNGSYLGIYSNVEPLGKAFLKRNFESPKGTLYEGTAIDFEPGNVERFEAKTNKKGTDRSRLKKIASLLEDPNNVDMNELGHLVDLDQFMKFWTAEMMLGHWDGYAGNRNNYFVYENPGTDQLEFLPWGTDGSFGADNLFISVSAPKIITARARLCAALYKNPTYRQQYLNTVGDLLENWWDTAALLSDIDSAVELVRPHLHLRERNFERALAELRQYIESVAPEVAKNLKNPSNRWLVSLPDISTPDPSGEQSESTDAPRWAGSVKSEFLIPFNQYEQATPVPLKPGSLDFVWQGKPLNFPLILGKSGYASSDPFWFECPELLIVRVSPLEGRNVWVHMDLDPDLLARGGDIRLHRSQIVSWFGTSVTGKPGFTLHGMLDGTLNAEIVEIDGVRHIKGTIDANLGSSKKELEF